MPRSTSYQKGHNYFTYRVAAVIQDAAPQGDRILLHRSARDDFWSLPGGKAELGEEAEQALLREMREELHSAVKIDRLLWVVENFFEDRGEKHHELGLYFLAHLSEDDPRREQSVFETAETCRDGGPLPLYFQWFPCQPGALAALDIRPAFLREGLLQIPNHVTNIKIG